jgi:uncharacterized protein YndB with AHSA1/START domain
MTSVLRHDPKLDLVLERTVDVPPGLVWECWTVPEHLMKWFTPKPWRTTECEIDLRPGGIFRTKMEGPNGEHGGGSGCVLEVVPSRRFVWTGALGPGWRPQASKAPFLFTAVISIEPAGKGTRYTATAIHSDEAGAKAHADMGFHQGWGAAFDQLVELTKGMS